MKRPEGFDAPVRASRPAPPRTSREQQRGAGKQGGAKQGGQPAPGATPRTAGAGQPAATQPKSPQPADPKVEARTRGAAATPPRSNGTAPGSRPAKASAPSTPARGTTTVTSRKPHPPAPRGPKVRQPVAEPGPARGEPRETGGRRSGAVRRHPSPEAEARRAARQRRRFERGEIRRFTRRSRNRRLAWTAGLLLVVGMFGGVAAAVFSPLFALSRIDIRGADRVDREDVHAALEGQLGTPLALLDEGAIRRELGGFPLIRSFITELVPPDTLVIRITERQPVGAIPSDGGFSLVDPAGVVVQSVEERPEGMPLIDVGDEDVPSTAYRSAAEVLLALPDDLAARVDTVTARTKDDVTLVLTESDQRVVWGSAEQSELKARVLAALVAQMGDSGPGRYDVSAPLTAVFRED